MNVIEHNFSKWGLLQSDFAQERAIQIIDGATLDMDPQSEAILNRAVVGTEYPVEQAWVCVLLDCAINSDLFIRHIEGDDVVYRHPLGTVHLPMQNVFGAVERIFDRLSNDDQAGVWDLAEKALERAAKRMRQ